MTVCYNNYFVLISDITSILKETPDEDEILRVLYDISDKWYDIGLSFQVRRNVLDDLKQSQKNDVEKFDEVIKILKRSQPSLFTWEALINAMESPIINNKKQANLIRQSLKFSKLLLLSKGFFINTVTVNQLYCMSF